MVDWTCLGARETQKVRVLPFQGMVVESSWCWMFWVRCGKEVLGLGFMRVGGGRKKSRLFNGAVRFGGYS